MDFLIHRSSVFVCVVYFLMACSCVIQLGTTLMIIITLISFWVKTLYKWLDSKPKADILSANTVFLCFVLKTSAHYAIFEISGADSLGVRNTLNTLQISLISKWKIVAIGFVCLLGGRGNWDDDALVPNHTRNNSSSRLVSCSFTLPNWVH